MLLTTKGRYAVMAMIDIAENGLHQPISLSVISERQNISLSYLEQIFTRLKKSDIVKSIKGPGGGYVLNKASDTITISEIMAATGEKIKMTRCSQKSSCTSEKLRCKTHNLWYGLEQNIFDYLSSISLQDVCKNNIRITGQLSGTCSNISFENKLDVGAL